MKTSEMTPLTEYFNVPYELMPFIPALHQDLWELGNSPQLIADWLRTLNLPENQTCTLDLGCGKGAVSLNLAKEFQFRVLGIDIFEPFINEAKAQAQQLGVSHLCEYEMFDLRDFVRSAHGFDMVLLNSVGGVLGSFKQTISRLRKCVKTGGYIVISDGFRWTSRYIDLPGYAHYMAYPDTIAQLTAFGDKMVNEKIFSKEVVKMVNHKNIKTITNEIEKLEKQHPELSSKFYSYLAREMQECEILENDIACAVWMMQKV